MSSESRKELTEQPENPPCKYKERLFRCKYPESIGYEIIERMAAGEPILKIAEDEHMPERSQIFWWLQGTVDHGAAGVLCNYYAQARAVRAENVANTVDFLISDQASDNPTRRHQNARVAMDGARWYLGRLGSPQWQEPTQRVEHSGHIGLSAMLAQLQDGDEQDASGSVLESARSRVIEGETVEDVESSGQAVDNDDK